MTHTYSTEEHPISRLMRWVSRISERDIQRVQSINHATCTTSGRTTPDEEMRICQMANAGIALYEIAKEFNRDKNTIRLVLAKEGVDMRHLSQRRKDSPVGTLEIGREILAEIKRTNGNIVSTHRKMGYTDKIAFESIALAGGMRALKEGKF